MYYIVYKGGGGWGVSSGERERELDDCWQERKFQKANTTPLIEIRNSAMWWLNYTHTHTHATIDTPYLLYVLWRNCGP